MPRNSSLQRTYQRWIQWKVFFLYLHDSCDDTHPGMMLAFLTISSLCWLVIDCNAQILSRRTAPLPLAPNPAFMKLTVPPNYSYIFLYRLHPCQAAPPIFKIILNSDSVFLLAVSVSLMLSADFIRTLFILSSKLLAKILSRTRFRADRHRKPLFAFLHSSSEPLITFSL